MKIGLYFGSFNPIHIGHLIIAEIMATHTDLDKVWLVVSPQNPLKPQRALIHEFDRLAMVERAIADNYRLQACDVEFRMSKPSYTIDTLTVLAEKYPQHELVVVMGGDNLANFKKWKNHEQILKFYALYVCARPGVEPPAEWLAHPRVHFVSAPSMEISATYIRECVREGKSIQYLVPEAVRQYIDQKALYLK